MNLYVNIRDNYLEYMRRRDPFRGVHNRRKVMILYCLAKAGQLSASGLYELVGRDITYSSLRATLTQMVKHTYIGHVEGATCREYRLRAKGKRFLYAATQLAPQFRSWAAGIPL